MSRVVAYLGPSTPISTVLEGGAQAPVDQTRTCPDGFGLGWYPEDEQEAPVRLVSRERLNARADILGVARRVHSSCTMTTLRSAPFGAVPELSGTQPLLLDRYLFCQTGSLSAFRSTFERPIRARLSLEAHQRLLGSTEEEILGNLWLDLLAGRTDRDGIADSLESLAAQVTEIAASERSSASLCVVLADRHTLFVLRTAIEDEPPPLYTIVASAGAPVPAGARLVASEPTYPGQWATIEENSLTIFTRDG